MLLVTSPRVAAGLLSSDAWAALHAGPVFVRDVDHPAVVPLVAAGVLTTAVDLSLSTQEIAHHFVAAAREAGVATWFVGPDGDQALARAVADLTAQAAAAGEALELEILHGSWDFPGSRLLDVVATMDRLRSPGGCPWDAEQDHESLAPYLLEEAYEAFQTIEDGNLDGLRDELGDVLLQVAFHARLAEELPDDERWTIDDVAGGLVDKLIRRHPHVFGDVAVTGSAEVNANWESIKAEERGGASPLSSVPLSAPALTLAATLQRKAARAGLNDGLPVVSPTLEHLVRQYRESPAAESAGDLLWALVEIMRADGVDPEAALRQRAREFRDAVEAAPVATEPDGTSV